MEWKPSFSFRDSAKWVVDRAPGRYAQALRDLGAASVRLMTNNPRKCDELRALGVAVAERVPLVTEPTAENLRYLRTKQDRMGHDLGLPGAGWAR